jgi:preprotein translocase subunit SecE
VSDERVDADAGTEEGRGGRTAVVTRPARPTGKRSRARAEASEAVELGKDGTDTKVKTAKKAAGPARNPFAFVFTYLKQVVAELRKVIWPNRKQMMTYTSVVLAFLAFMVALIGLADFGLAKLVLLVFG